MTAAPGLRQRLGPLLGPLGEAPFRMLWLGQTTSAVGDAMIPVAIAFAVIHLGGDAGGIGLVLTAFTVPRLVFILVGGVWADRLPRQQVMLVADVIRGAVEVGFAVLLLSGTAQLWHLAAGAAVIGAASAFFAPASTGLIPQVASPARLQQANALMSLSRGATGIIGPSVSGLLVATVGVGWIFAVDAGTFVASTISLLLLRVPRRVEPAPHASFLTELAGGWREVVSRTWLRTAIGAFAVSNVCLAPFFVLGPFVAERSLGGAADWGLIVTAQAVGGLLGGLVALRWRPARPIAAGFMLGPIFFVPLLFLAPPVAVPLIMLASLLALASMELSNTWWYTVLQQQIPPQALSRVSSYDWLVSLIFQPLGFMLVGPVSETIGPTTTLVAAATVGIVTNLVALSVPSIRRLGWREEAPAPAGPPDAPMPVAEGPVAGPLEIE
jgi:MFS family permease